MVDPSTFDYWFQILCDRFRVQFSEPTIALYREMISERLTTEQFTLAAERLFFEGKTMPSPADFVESGKAVLPPESSPTVVFADPSPEELEQIKAAIAVAREIAQAGIAIGKSKIKSSVFSTVGTVLGDSTTLEQQLSEYRQQLADPVLRHEAIAWANNNPDIEIVTDENGAIDLREVAF